MAELNHEHRWFPFKHSMEFVPIESTDGEVLYRKYDWLISNCNCGAAIKRAVTS